MKKENIQITVICLVMILIGIALCMFIYHGTGWLSNNYHQNRAFKVDSFTQSKYSKYGSQLLEIEGSVREQIELARKFFDEYWTSGEDDKYQYEKGANALMIEMVTNDKFTVNKHGDYIEQQQE